MNDFVSVFDNLHLKTRRQSDASFGQDLLGRLQKALTQSGILGCFLDELTEGAPRFHDQQVITKESAYRTKEGCRSRHIDEVPFPNP